jgi:hypothetical protein
MNLKLCKEEFSSGLGCDTPYIGCQSGHLREPIDDQKSTIMTMFGGGTP